MKKIMLGLMLALASIANAQTFKAPVKNSSTIKKDSTTTYKYDVGDTIYKVYVGQSGAFYIWKKSSKTGKLYKYYLPKDIQIKMGRKYDE